MNLPLEGRAAPWLRDVVRPAATARPDEPRGAACARGDFVVVVDDAGVVLGLLGRRAAASDDEATVEQAMREGPRTFRPHETLAGVRKRLESRGIAKAIVTTLDGKLVGVVDL
jgi:CBS domain-containing protein